jgi:hypothetical protein
MLHLQNTHQEILTHQPPPLHTVIIKGGLQWTSTGNEARATMSKLIYESCEDHFCTQENKKIDPFLCLNLKGILYGTGSQYSHRLSICHYDPSVATPSL